MAKKYLFDISNIDLNRVLYDQNVIREVNPHRDAFELLNGVVWVDPENARLVGYKDVREDEFWVSGHIPGRPLLPGVLMIEAGAQLASFYTKKIMGWKGFVGFGGVENCRFRQQVSPGCRLYLLGERAWERHHRIYCHLQGIVDGNPVFEADIIGLEF